MVKSDTRGRFSVVNQISFKKFRVEVAGDNHEALGSIPPPQGVVTHIIAAILYLVESTLPQALTAWGPGNSIPMPMPRETILADAYLMPKASRTP